MKFLFCLGVFSFYISAVASGQGSLTPSAPPGPTMKTLDQVEARIPIPGGTTPFVATASGSYYLTGSLTTTNTAIDIRADNVTVDLNGFTITSAANSTGGSGIYIVATSSVTVCNGHIKSLTTYDSSGNSFSPAGFSSGVDVTSGGTTSVQNLDIIGVRDYGIIVSQSSRLMVVVSHCQINISKDYGIFVNGTSTIENCMVYSCGSTAISGT